MSPWPEPAQPPDPDELGEWCRRWLRSPPERTVFHAGNVSSVIGLQLADGRTVVVKYRRPAERIAGCVAVQRHLADAGFPCPRPLAGPAPLGDLTATAESYLSGGRQLARSSASSRRFGQALARLVSMAPPVASLPTLDPPPAWLRSNHDEPGPWPVPESTPADLNALAGPPWLDEVARRVRTRLTSCAAPPVVGHADFESQNVRWRAGRLHVVHDWDSSVGLPEAVIAGAAAAMFPATGPAAAAATLGETNDFLDAYSRSRRQAWGGEEREVCWAAGLWVLAYNAKVGLAEGSQALARDLAGDAEQRLDAAGA